MEKEATLLRKFAGGPMGLNMTRCIALFLAVSVPVLRGVAGLAETVSEVKTAELPQPMAVRGAKTIPGDGALPCVGSIAGGILLGKTLIGALVGAILIVCCCAGGLDDRFRTRFRQACSCNAPRYAPW